MLQNKERKPYKANLPVFLSILTSDPSSKSPEFVFFAVSKLSNENPLTMKTSLGLLLCGVIPATPLFAGGSEHVEKKRPNMLIILLDDAGYNDFGFMGSPDLRTPHIDSLAHAGVICSDAHVSASVSGPSRCGLLTGRYQQRNGYECNLGAQGGMGLDEETIGDLFSRNGYHTACFGKWHQGNAPEYHPNRRGFAYFYGFIAGSRSYFYRPERDDRPGDARRLQCNGRPEPFDGYLTDRLAEAAGAYIEEMARNKEPFLIYLAFNAVHTPMEATAEDLARFEGHPRQKLAAMTWAVDRGVGRVVRALKESGVFDHTLIFFLSDNGGAHNNQSQNTPLKGFKGNKFEGGHRVPFFLVYGDRFRGRYDGLTSSLDILPTALAAAGIDERDTKNPLDGTNLLPYLCAEKNGDPHTFLFWRKNNQAAARMGRYKYIRVQGVGERLYDLERNLAEDQDLCSQKPEIRAQIAQALDNWQQELVNPPLWDEGEWEPVNIDIHRNLMENRPVDCHTPAEFKRRHP